MKWDDICDDEILVVQEKTGTKAWIPLHRDLKELLDQTARNGEYILNSSWGGPFAIKNTLKRVGEGPMCRTACAPRRQCD